SQKTVPIIYVAHDCEYSLIRQSTRNPLIHALIYRFEKFACSKASKILCVSELDMHELQHTYDIPSEKMAVLPNTVDTHSLSETLAVYDKAEERHNLGISASSFVLLFHGRMDYRPNMDALRFILDELVPVLHHSHLTLKILVAGAQVPKWCFDYENKIVSFYSDVPDMRRFLAVADAIIVPLFAGGGTRLKVLEAFAARVPVISTAKGVEGIRCKDRHDILIADETAEDFARNIETLAMSESLKTHLIENSYWLVQKEYGVEAAGKCLRQVVNEIGG
ncbi:MAG: glycosyltransferase family 4 protein, partial [Planctomycetes bacterium]|nr:glycosyltransferase family 4 protein [Planctomycetota bacterium]